MTESSIYQPTPNSSTHSRSTSESSKRLLASHHSVFDLLKQQQSNISNSNLRYSPNLDINISNNPSFQSIGDYLIPRPTSSVLSNSDTEDEFMKQIHQRDISESTVHVYLNNSYIDDDNYEEDEDDDDDDEDDQNTIEININQGRTNKLPFSATISSIKDNNIENSFTSTSSSSFILPEVSTNKLFDTLEQSYNDNAKILIIGHKKSNFFKMLNKPLSNKFTLNIQESYNIILVIFDGLIKIGNILNFIKQNKDLLQDKLFIPIFKNINQLVVNKIITTYHLNLLCPPINYNNKNQVENLLELLNQDFLLKESFISNKALTFENNSLISENSSINKNEYQLVTINGNSNSKILSESVQDNSSSIIVGSNKLFEENKFPNTIDHLSSRSNSQTRKQRYKRQKKSNFVFLSMTLSLGIGIGITTAYALSYVFTSSTTGSEKEFIDPLFTPNFETKSILKRGFLSTKDNIILFKQTITGVTKIVWSEVNHSLKSAILNWDKYITNYSNSSNYSLLWMF